LRYNSPYIKNPLRIIYLLFLVGIFFSNAVLQIACGLFLPYIIYFSLNKSFESKLNTIEKLILALFFSGIISIFISPIPSLAFKNIIRHSILLTIIPIAFISEKDELVTIKLIVKLFSVFGLLTAAFGIYRYFNGAERAFGFFAGYYTLASLLAFSIPITFAHIFYSKKFWRYLTYISVVVQAIALWLTFTRSALLGIVFGSLAVLSYLLLKSKISKTSKKKILFASILIFMVITILLFTSSDARFNPLMIFSNPDISSGRTEVYFDAYKTFTSDLEKGWMNILFGHGLNSRIILFPNSLYTSWESDYIESFMTQGFIGLIIVILIYYQFFKNLFKLLFRTGDLEYKVFALCLSISGIAFWIISFFSSQLVGQNSSAYFVVLYSLILVIDRVSKKDEVNSQIN
jgi:hypothetical protein